MNVFRDPDFLERLHTSAEPLYLQTYKQLLAHILNGKWQCGDRLPPDMHLARKLGINHITLSKAMNRLAEEGYLLRNRGRGTYISTVLPQKKNALKGTRVALIYDIDNENAFSGDIFINVHIALGKLGLRLEFLTSGGSRSIQFHQLQKLFSEADSAGCILWSILDNRQLGIIESSRPPDYPLIFIDHKPEITARGFDFSGFDDFAAGKQLGQHLKQSGFSACSCCFQSRFADFSTNRNRLAGLSAGLGFEPEIFTAYSSRHSRPFQEYCHEVSHRGIPTALVLISEIDLPFFERMPPVDRENLTPYAFFTAVAPRCSGIQLPDGEMGRGAVELIAARRAGDTSFSLSRTFGGTLVGV